MSDALGRTPLHLAAMKNDVDALTEGLSAGDAASSTEDRFGWTPLHFAAEYGAVDAAKVLLAAGANVDARGVKDGQTPLWRAVMKRKKSPDGSMIRYLVQSGADADVADANGKTPRALAEGLYQFDLSWLEG